MSIHELLENSDKSNISVTVNLKDLQDWHKEVIESKFSQLENEKTEDERLTPADICKVLGITRATLTRWDRAGLLPKYKIGGKCFYRKSEIEDFIQKSKIVKHRD